MYASDPLVKKPSKIHAIHHASYSSSVRRLFKKTSSYVIHLPRGLLVVVSETGYRGQVIVVLAFRACLVYSFLRCVFLDVFW